MKALHPHHKTRPAALCRRIAKLERTGRYDVALELLNIDLTAFTAPDLDGLRAAEAAELTLRCAAVLGFHGHNLRIENSQQRTRDLLTNARDHFLAHGPIEKVWESEVHIALTYWRTGEYNEALIWTEGVLADAANSKCDSRLYAEVVRSLLLLHLDRQQENIDNCERLASIFFEFGDAFLTGSYCTNVGLSFKNAGRIDEALRYLELARDFHEVSGHRIYLGTVENNLAQLYRADRRFARAHTAIDNAIRSFRKAHDATREGFSLDTKALILFAEGKYAQALNCVDTGIELLRKSENAGYLAETLETRARVQMYLNDLSGALATLAEAVAIVMQTAGERPAREIFERFAAVAGERNARFEKPVKEESVLPAGGDLDLVLPSSLAGYPDYQGLWINNTHLEPVGLKKGSLAVVVRDEIKRGDLVAISELDRNSIVCGFYDEDFGIVCLEGINTEPQLFDARSVKILGRIIGVCPSPAPRSGKLVVQPLK